MKPGTASCRSRGRGREASPPLHHPRLDLAHHVCGLSTTLSLRLRSVHRREFPQYQGIFYGLEKRWLAPPGSSGCMSGVRGEGGEAVSLHRGTYPKSWKTIATEIKTAAGWRCERCGHRHETSTKRLDCDDRCHHLPDRRQRMLTVHHLDNNKSNVRRKNLAALCQVCHLVIQGSLRTGTKEMLQHGTLFGVEPWLEKHLERVRSC